MNQIEDDVAQRASNLARRPSYPFMRLAAELRVPYGTVLLAADWYARLTRELTVHNVDAYFALTPPQRTAVLQTLHEERQWQRAVLWQGAS